MELRPTPEERGLYRLAPFPNPQRPATQRTPPCAYDANSLPRQTLIPDSTGAASASMPRYAIVINALRPLRAGGRCNSAIIALLEIAYMPTEIRPYSRHRRNCDRRKQGRFRRGYMDVFTPCHRIACAKSAPQVIGYTVAGSYDSRCSSGLKSCRFGFQTQSILLQKKTKTRVLLPLSKT